MSEINRWSLCGDDDNWYVEDCDASGDNRIVAIIPRPANDSTESEAIVIANARVLLDACKSALDAFWGTCESPGQSEVIDKLRAVISEAEGRSE